MNAELVLYMGTSMLAGSLLGAFGSVYLPQSLIHFVYGTMATIAAAFMIIPKKKKERAFGEQISFHKPLAVGLAFGIGVVSGIVGAGGAFMLIPVMLTALNIPTRVAIASSLAIVFMSSIGGAIGKWATGQVPYGAVAFTVLGSLIGAPLGSMVGRRMSVGALRWALALFIVCAAAKTWLDMI